MREKMQGTGLGVFFAFVAGATAGAAVALLDR